MEYLYELIFLVLILFLLFIGFVLFKKHNIKKEEKKIIASLKLILKKNIATNKKNVNKNDNLFSGEAKNGGGIISHKTVIKTNSKEQMAKWVDTESYEEDIKQNTLTDENEEDMKKITIKSLILLVDDSLVVRKYVGDLLRKYNYDLVIKTDGWEAITYLNGGASQKPDLIISDIQMPNMDGFQLIEAIRKEKKYKNVPILVISAHVEAHDHLVLMEQENIQGFIRKPFEDNDLITQTNYLINNF